MELLFYISSALVKLFFILEFLVAKGKDRGIPES
jgi:hypothetical protein